MLSALGSESLLPLSGTAGIKVFQTALNKDYGADLVVDGIFGLNTDKALGKHYVTSGECQYMVTAAEILLLLHGYNPNRCFSNKCVEAGGSNIFNYKNI